MFVFYGLEQGSKNMVHFKQEADEQYHNTLANLEKISSTIQFLDATISKMKVEVRGTLDWIAGMVGGTGKMWYGNIFMSSGFSDNNDDVDLTKCSYYQEPLKVAVQMRFLSMFGHKMGMI